MKRSSFTTGGWWFYLLLAAMVLVMYAPSLRFGLIWDDPRWYQQGAGQSPWHIFTALSSYQFYRPLAILLNRQLVFPNGVVNAPLAHAIQIGAHLVAVLACVPVLRAFEFELWHARLTALLFAVSPLAFQAVAWQAPLQPLTMMWLLLAALTADRFVRGRCPIWLILSLLTYAAALLFQESAVPFVFVFFWLALRHRPFSSQQGWWWPLLHLGLAAAYIFVWLNVPRRGNVTGQGFQPIVLAYLLQGIVWPVSHWITGWVVEWPLVGLIGIWVVAGLFLILGVGKGGAVRTAMWNTAWIAAGLLPVWVGLAWVYVETGTRLLYPASLGIAGLWGGWAAWALSADQARWRRGLGALTLVAVLLVSFQQWRQFQRLYQVGTGHLARAVKLLSAAPDSRLLFVNFPDRIELRPRPYPMGYWGIVLSPIVQNLSDYARAETGRSGADRSASSFQVGADERGAWPYRVDMRGEDKGPGVLFQAALESDAVYLTRYRPDGTLDLQAVGSVRPARSTNTLAVLGDVAQLAEASADVSASRVLTLKLTWRCLGTLRENDTLFVHFWKDGAFMGDADGDSLGGLIPLTAWRPGTEILDVRQVDVSAWGPGRYQVRAGVYNRVDGKRYPARSSDGSQFPDHEVLVYAFTYP